MPLRYAYRRPIYSDSRPRYLLNHLRNGNKSLDDLKLGLTGKDSVLWTNIFYSVLESRTVSWRESWVHVNTRPSVIRRLSSRVEKHIRTMNPKPDIVIQWFGLFAPFLKTPVTLYVLIEDNYSDPPGSLVQKRRLRGWTRPMYQESFSKITWERGESVTFIQTVGERCVGCHPRLPFVPVSGPP